MKLAPKEWPESFLNHQWGTRVERGKSGTKVQMWGPWEEKYDAFLTWWVMDADAVGGPQGVLISAEKEVAKEALEGRELEIANKVKELEKKEAAFAQTRREFDAKQSSGGNGEAAKADLAVREQKLATKSSELKQMEAALFQAQKALETEQAKAKDRVEEADSARKDEAVAKLKDLVTREAALALARQDVEAERKSSATEAARLRAEIEVRDRAIIAQARDVGQREASLVQAWKDVEVERAKVRELGKNKAGKTKPENVAPNQRSESSRPVKSANVDMAVAATNAKIMQLQARLVKLERQMNTPRTDKPTVKLRTPGSVTTTADGAFPSKPHKHGKSGPPKLECRCGYVS